MCGWGVGGGGGGVGVGGGVRFGGEDVSLCCKMIAYVVSNVYYEIGV